MSYEVNQRIGGEGTIADAFLFYQDNRPLTEGARWAFTSAENSFLLTNGEFPLGIEFKADPGLQRDGIEATNETQAAEIKVTVAHDNPVALQWKQQQPEWPIWMKLYRVQLATGRAVRSYVGQVVNGAFSDEICELTVTSLKGLLQRRIPTKRYQSLCNNQLYDQFCTINRANYQARATITAIDGRVILVTWDAAGSFLAVPQESGFFTAGYLDHPTGTSSGGKEMIAVHSELGGLSGKLVLLQQNSWLQVGDVINVYAGCSRLMRVCKFKFNNLAHFIGSPFIPAVDPYTGGVE